MPRIRAESTDEGLTGVSPRFVINAISNAITRNNMASLTSMDMLLALKDAIETDARMDASRKKQWIEFLVLARKDFYNRWVKEDVHRALFASFQEEAQQLLEKYLDEIEASLDKRIRILTGTPSWVLILLERVAALRKARGDTSLFAAYFPANAPKYVVVAVVEEGGRGASVAAPIVRRVIEAITGVQPAPVAVEAVTGTRD